MFSALKIRPFVDACSRAALGAALGFSLFTAMPAGAQTVPPAPAVMPAEGEGPQLWVVRDEDSTLYLFGTVHVLKADTPWGSDRVDRAFDSASEIWLEIPNPDDQTGALPLIQQYGFDPSRPLSSILSAEEFAQLDAAARAVGASGAQFDAMRPWMAGLTLGVASLAKAGYRPQSGSEIVLLARARAAGKPVKGLETFDQQVRLLAGMSDEAQIAFLKSALDDFENATTLFETLIGAWSKGDMATLERLVVEDMKDTSAEVYETLLARRNTDWADQIQQMLSGSGTAFIAVGAGHLVGEDSVQAILERRGVTVSIAD